jgi:serine/threonine protein kinase/tetratricopeptide (TPR) repeat protein
MIGKIISHYKILEALGEGGMGVVYRAEDMSLGRMVALKFLPPALAKDLAARERFLHEARAASKLDHRNICAIYEIAETSDGQVFIAMAYYEGETLKERIERGPLGISDLIDLALQTAEGLKQAHEAGITHRDIKPANIMIAARGEVKLLDFGLAKLAGATRLTKEGTTLGTVQYMSPEQARGEQTDHRGDIWSFGAVLYEMATGRSPFRGEHEPAVIYSIMHDEPEPPTALRSGVPMELERIIMKALAKDPAERYQHADEMLTDFKRLARGLAASGSAGTPAPRPASEPPSRALAPKSAARRFGVPLATVAIVAAIVVGVLVLRPFLSERKLAAAPKPIAVISFENLTGDPSYDYLSKAIPNLLITSLEQSRLLQVMTWERMHDLLKQLGRGEAETIDRNLGFELCNLDGIDAMVVGTFTKGDNTFSTEAKLLDVHTKELLCSASATGEGVASILLRQIDVLTRQLSKGAGLSQSTIQRTIEPVTEVTTSSMEAYELFLRARDAYEKIYDQQARELFERAVALDSTFFSAYQYLGLVCDRQGDVAAEMKAFRQAGRFAWRATERERLYGEMFTADKIENNKEKSISFAEELMRKYPKEKRVCVYVSELYGRDGKYAEAVRCIEKALALDPTYALAANGLAYVYMASGDYSKAMESLERYAALAPGDANPFDSMAELLFRMGRLDEAIEQYRRALRARPDFVGSMQGIFYMYGVEGKMDSAFAWLDRYIGAAPMVSMKAVGEYWRAFSLSILENYPGAVAAHRNARALFESAGNPATALGEDLGYASSAYHAGDYATAASKIEEWRTSMESVSPGYPAYVAFGYSGIRCLIEIKRGALEPAAAELRAFEAACDTLAAQDPPGAVQLSFGRFILRGELMLAEGDIEGAIRFLGSPPASSPPRMLSDQCALHNFPFDIDVLARAYVRKGDIDKAVAEYERLITFDPSGPFRRIYNPRYNYRLAKLYEVRGMREKAIEQYERYLSFARYAAPGVPEIADARKRLDALKRQ